MQWATLHLLHKVKVKVLVTQSCPNLCDPMDYAAHQTPLSMKFYRQEHWSGLPFPSPGDLLTQGLNLSLPHCRKILYCLSHQGTSIKNRYSGNAVMDSRYLGAKRFHLLSILNHPPCVYRMYWEVWKRDLPAGNALEGCACVYFSDVWQWPKNAHIFAERMAS